MKVTNTEAISKWLEMLWNESGSDLLLSGGSPPRIRVDGRLRPVDGEGPMTGEEVDQIVRSLLDPAQAKTFDEYMDVDFSFSWEDKARLRASVFTQRGLTALAVRMIPTQIPTFDELGLPPVAKWIAGLPRWSRLGHGADRIREVNDSGFYP